MVASTGDVRDPNEFDIVGERITKWLRLTGEQRVLDVGCASGTLTTRWSPAAQHVTAVDFSRVLIDEANRRHGGDQLDFEIAEAGSLPFDDQTFDAVCCYNVIPAFPDHGYVDQAISEFLRVAKPGARIVIGSLPDQRKREAFYDLMDASSHPCKRLVPRRLRWSIKRMLKPGAEPGQTKILWFDLEQMATNLRAQGCEVEVVPDPDFAHYSVYRQTVIVTRGANPSASPGV